MKILSGKPFRGRMLLVTAILGLLGGITAVGYWSECARRESRSYQELAAISRLKADELQRWHDGMILDLKRHAAEASLTELIAAWCNSPEAVTSRRLGTRLAELKAEHGFEYISGYFFAENRKYTAGDTDSHRERRIAVRARTNQQQVRVTGTGIYFDSTDSLFRLDYLMNVASREIGHPVRIYIACDPYRSVFPIVEGWPVPTGSAGCTLIQTREDEYDKILPYPGEKKSAPIIDRVSDAEKSAIKRLREGGTNGEFQIDFDGNPYLAVAIRVPGSSWYIISRIARSEATEGAQESALALCGIIAFALLALAAVLRVDTLKHGNDQYRRETESRRLLLLTQREMHDCIEQSERQYRSMFEDHSAPQIIVDAVTGAILDANCSASGFYGLEHDELCTMNLSDLSALEIDRESGVGSELALLGAMRYESRHKVAKGEVRDVEVFAGEIKYPKRFAALCFVQDVTDRRRAHSWNVLLKSLVEQSPVGIFITNKLGTIIYINRAYSELTGYSEEELCGSSPEIVYGRAASRIIASGDRPGERRSNELLNRRKNGESYWERIEVSPLINDQGETTNFICITLDVTAQKRMLDEIQMAKERAEQSDRLKSTFLANMSHEVRTPMNAIVGFADLLANCNCSVEERKDYARIIIERTQDLLHIINDILDLSLIEVGQIKVVKEQFHLLDEMNDLLMTFNRLPMRIEKQSVVLNHVSDIEPDTQSILTDPCRVRQVMTILLQNALKYTEHGAVNFGCRSQDPEHVIFYVSDTGIGIPKEALSYIFDNFRQVDESSSRHYGGTGLGLAIARGLVQMLGGSINVESEPGTGSTFWFWLPR